MMCQKGSADGDDYVVVVVGRIAESSILGFPSLSNVVDVVGGDDGGVGSKLLRLACRVRPSYFTMVALGACLRAISPVSALHKLYAASGGCSHDSHENKCLLKTAISDDDVRMLSVNHRESPAVGS